MWADNPTYQSILVIRVGYLSYYNNQLVYLYTSFFITFCSSPLNKIIKHLFSKIQMLLFKNSMYIVCVYTMTKEISTN